MRACDVSCARYLRRLEAAAGAELMPGYSRGVAESFELSLRQARAPTISRRLAQPRLISPDLA